MDIIYTHCAGLDIHKKSVVACRMYPDEQGKLIREIRTFETFTVNLLELSDWLAAVGISQVAMESTGEYWKPVYNLLEGHFELLVVNAQHIKAVPGRKTDVRDAEWIAQRLRHGLLKASFIPEPAQRDLRELTRLRTTVMGERARTVNCLQKVLESANIKLASVVSDVSGVSAQAMLRQLAAGNSAALAALAKGQLRDKRPELERALSGLVRPVHRFLLSNALATLDHYDGRLARIEEEIERHMVPFEELLARLDSIPGVDVKTAQVIIAELGTDMSRFANAGHAAWRTAYVDLGGNYFDARKPDLIQKQLIQRLEKLGLKVTVEPLHPAA